MIYNFPRFQEIKEKLGLTPNQIYICLVLMETNKENKRELIEKYKQQHKGFEQRDIDTLIEKEYLLNLNTTNPNVETTILKKESQEKFKPIVKKTPEGETLVIQNRTLDLLVVTDKFKEGIFIDNDDAAEEIWSIYPKWMNINNKRQSTKSILYEEFKVLYGNLIQGNGILHKKIVECVSNYKKVEKAGHIQLVGIKKFFENKIYNDIEELLEDLEGEKDSINDL